VAVGFLDFYISEVILHLTMASISTFTGGRYKRSRGSFLAGVGQRLYPESVHQKSTRFEDGLTRPGFATL